MAHIKWKRERKKKNRYEESEQFRILLHNEELRDLRLCRMTIWLFVGVQERTQNSGRKTADWNNHKEIGLIKQIKLSRYTP
jgi:hypothetical protein